MKNLFQQAKNCFQMADPQEKAELTFSAAGDWQANKLEWNTADKFIELHQPGRLDKPEIVLPKNLGKRKFNNNEGRAALIHALAHIELTAVNLAWDTIYRYRGMPKDYYDDWVQCAKEEATHFLMLRNRLREMGFDYGSFKAHNELWKMAENTAGNMTDRMAIVHRVFEARALDVIPGTIKRFESIGDNSMVSILNTICNEEVGHVSSGARWYRYRCEQEKVDPDEKFVELLNQYMTSPIRGPLNRAARLAAGFSEAELDYLESNS